MFLPLSDLRTELTNRIKSNSAVLSSSRLTNWLNLAQEDIANEFDFLHLLDEISVTSSTTTRKLYVPLLASNKVRSIVDTAQDYLLQQTSKDRLLRRDPDESDSGNPYLYAVEGYGAIRGDHSAGVVELVSSSASDTSQKVRITGLTSGNVYRTELLTLNGLTTVTGTIIFTEVKSLSKDNTTTGVVTASIGATTIAQLGPDSKIDENLIVYLYPTPADAATFVVRGYRRPKAMVNDQDYPDFPSMYHELVLLGGVIRGHKDLFRFNLANDIAKNELLPRIVQIKQSQNYRSTKSQIIRESSGDTGVLGRLPSNYPLGD